MFDYDRATDSFVPNKTATIDCGFACHTRVANKDYIFHGVREEVRAGRVLHGARSRRGAGTLSIHAALNERQRTQGYEDSVFTSPPLPL